MASTLWALFAAAAALLGLVYAGLGAPPVLALMSAWVLGSTTIGIALIVRPVRAVFAVSAIAGSLTAAVWVVTIPGSTYIEEPITLALLGAAAALFSAIGYMVSLRRQALSVKAYSFIRASVLWFALFFAIFMLLYVSVLPWIVNLVFGSH